ncbi:TspO/MBR family protein [Nocardioides sp. P5_C9_2]
MRVVATVAWVAIVVLYAGLSSVWTGRDPGWYASLSKPSFQPPDVVFGVMWPLNFLALLVVGVWVTRSSSTSSPWPAIAVLATSVVAALAWAWLFYVPHRLGVAAVCLALAALLTWLLVVIVAGSLPWAGGLLVPYALWLSVATALSVRYAGLN